MIIPSREQANMFLMEAAELNPGPWVAHSQYAAQAAQVIAQANPGLDPDQAYVLGLLHDIGRREGVHGMRHVLDGYNFLTSKGWPDAARICMTHSYPIKEARAGASPWDGSEAEFRFVEHYLAVIEYDEYDRLIQLCDAICLPTGYCLMEKRLVDVARRYGFNRWTLQKWDAYFAILDAYNQAAGCSIYSLLPDVVQNSFGFTCLLPKS